jgi:hypothetical protein
MAERLGVKAAVIGAKKKKYGWKFKSAKRATYPDVIEGERPADYARRVGLSRARVGQLRKSGRLVFADAPSPAIKEIGLPLVEADPRGEMWPSQIIETVAEMAARVGVARSTIDRHRLRNGWKFKAPQKSPQKDLLKPLPGESGAAYAKRNGRSSSWAGRQEALGRIVFSCGVCHRTLPNGSPVRFQAPRGGTVLPGASRMRICSECSSAGGGC